MQFPRPILLSYYLAALVLLFAFASPVQPQDARSHSQSPLPPPTGFVNDFANVIDDASEERLEKLLVNLKERADIEFAVVTVPTTGGQEIFNYSLAVARGWGIGSPEGEKNGLLLLVAVNDRKYYVQVSRHLEGDLPDGLVGEIGRRMREPFRAGDYSTGIRNAVETFIATIGAQRGFTLEEVNPALAYKPAERPPAAKGRRRGGFTIGTCCVIAVVALIIISMFRGGRGGRGGGGGLLNALLLANIASSIASSGRESSSGWGGSGDGGSSGWGGGGGFGGFGGGGDFGGGGAGGDW